MDKIWCLRLAAVQNKLKGLSVIATTTRHFTTLYPFGIDSVSASDSKLSASGRNDGDFREAAALLQTKKAFLLDCDGVLYHGDKLLPGVKEFLSFLEERQLPYLFVTNASHKSSELLSERMARLGIIQPPEKFFSSILATASFLAKQKRGNDCSCFVIGEPALFDALEAHGLRVMNTELERFDFSSATHEKEIPIPEYVVLGETVDDSIYNFSAISLACRLVLNGAKLIGTNLDVADKLTTEINSARSTKRIVSYLLPGTGALVKPIEAVTGKQAYFLGKPNPFMVTAAIEALEELERKTAGTKEVSFKKHDCVIVGDRMDTDIQLGVESGLTSILVLSGVSDEKEMEKYAFRPSIVLQGVGDIPKLFA